MLDKRQIRNLFAMLCDLTDEELEKWAGLCESAESSITSRLRENVDVKRNMERLCIAAAACAYFDYMMLSGGAGASSEVKVGDISVKNSGESPDARSIRDNFIAEIADLINVPTGFAFTSAECVI